MFGGRCILLFSKTFHFDIASCTRGPFRLFRARRFPCRRHSNHKRRRHVTASSSRSSACGGDAVAKSFDGSGDPAGCGRAVNETRAETAHRALPGLAAGANPRATARPCNEEDSPGTAGRRWPDATVRGHVGPIRSRLRHPVSSVDDPLRLHAVASVLRQFCLQAGRRLPTGVPGTRVGRQPAVWTMSRSIQAWFAITVIAHRRRVFLRSGGAAPTTRFHPRRAPWSTATIRSFRPCRCRPQVLQGPVRLQSSVDGRATLHAAGGVPVLASTLPACISPSLRSAPASPPTVSAGPRCPPGYSRRLRRRPVAPARREKARRAVGERCSGALQAGRSLPVGGVPSPAGTGTGRGTPDRRRPRLVSRRIIDARPVGTLPLRARSRQRRRRRRLTRDTCRHHQAYADIVPARVHAIAPEAAPFRGDQAAGTDDVVGGGDGRRNRLGKRGIVRAEEDRSPVRAPGVAVLDNGGAVFLDVAHPPTRRSRTSHGPRPENRAGLRAARPPPAGRPATAGREGRRGAARGGTSGHPPGDESGRLPS